MSIIFRVPRCWCPAMTTVDYFPIQDLPAELEREIFEVAARMRPNSALDLVLVARRVRAWIQPLIYEMVTLGTDDTSLFLRTMDELPGEFFQQNVKRLCLTVSVEPEAAARILATCSGVRSLACWVDFRAVHHRVQFSPLIASQRLRRLSMEIRHFRQLCREPLCHGALFLSLTRLDLIYWQPGELVIWELAALPHLTHLGIIIRDLPVTEAYLLSLIYMCPSLKVMAVLIDEGADPVPTRDLRIVWLPYPVMVLDWEAPFRGQEDTLARAEDIVKSRERELASSPCIDLTWKWA
ncbi:uncharacterized protein BT62DRAFT_1074334 [Guyanagaster necrorhizus]|uniref:Uncharacterized protein n=1 Tax=Guyanagaster necrorhizus TaxID=856835 RepID=A0A9P7VWY7_9AGAR|nr:uncharacterized protein BT62DRAFT_1074334 [Guyanagaster necrorhizus MCA 3950]KAG7448798.1 hypothetical protein BT62DRAFT_1074334 [Guyanagaster necrorhizus MCA 3950]